MKKRCSKCGIIKDLSEFLKDKTKADGHRADCTECRNKNRRKYYNPEKNKEHQDNWALEKSGFKTVVEYKEWKELLKEEREEEWSRLREGRETKELWRIFRSELMEYTAKTIRIFNKQRRLKQKREYQRIYTIEKIKYDPTYARKYYLKQREDDIDSFRKKHSNWVSERKKNSPEFKITVTLRGRLRGILKCRSIPKTFSALELVGCSICYLKQHLEEQFQPGMTWKNHTTKGWHIDHIIPCASFDLTDLHQQRECFHYTNLQPLWWQDNLAKGSRIQGSA